MSSTWPVAELDTIQRLRVMAAAVPGAAVTERLVDAPLDRVWAVLADFPGGFTQVQPDMRVVRVVQRAGDEVTLHALSRHGMRAQLHGTERSGWCWLQSRFLIIAMAAVQQPDARTRVALTGGIRLPGRGAILPIGVRREARHSLDRLEQRLASTDNPARQLTTTACQPIETEPPPTRRSRPMAASSKDQPPNPGAAIHAIPDPTMSPELAAPRHGVRFASGNSDCAAWHYPGTNRGCVIMAGGAGVTKEPGTDRFARVFHDAGFTVLAFDYRRFGDSGGTPRQIIRIREQLEDWRAATTYAASLPDVDPARIAIWGFSLSGGHVLNIAAENPDIAAAIAQTPLADGQAAAPNALKHMTMAALLRLMARAARDGLRGVVRRQPIMVSAAGTPGEVAILTTPDALDATRALDPDGQYDDWIQTIAARWALRAGSYRPGRRAGRIRCPLLVIVCDQDQSVTPEPGARAALAAPCGELVRMPGGHYEPFLSGHEQAVTAEIDFLRRHLLTNG